MNSLSREENFCIFLKAINKNCLLHIHFVCMYVCIFNSLRKVTYVSLYKDISQLMSSHKIPQPENFTYFILDIINRNLICKYRKVNVKSQKVVRYEDIICSSVTSKQREKNKKLSYQEIYFLMNKMFNPILTSKVSHSSSPPYLTYLADIKGKMKIKLC